MFKKFTILTLFLASFLFTWEVLKFSDTLVSEDSEWLYPEAEFRSTARRLAVSRWNCTGSGCLDPEDIFRLSWEVSKFSKTFKINSETVFKVLMVENPWLDSTAVSSAGALGLMQVMPFHAGNWEGCGESLRSVSGNLCHSFSILEAYSLLKYNGCTKSYCRDYVRRVEGAF